MYFINFQIVMHSILNHRFEYNEENEKINNNLYLINSDILEEILRVLEEND